MSLTKAELEEMVETLACELRQETARSRALLEENRKLCDLLRQASAQYQKLFDYVKRLRDWAKERAA